jgi:uncharacterized protein YjbJ (UPF0337 family)
MWNKNERAGKVEQVKGKAKQAVGRATGNQKLTDEGIDAEVAGKAQATVGKATRKVGETIEKVGKALKR